jgi:hypothetical protein
MVCVCHKTLTLTIIWKFSSNFTDACTLMSCICHTYLEVAGLKIKVNYVRQPQWLIHPIPMGLLLLYGLLILSCEEAIHLTYRRLLVLPRSQNVPEVMKDIWGLPQSVMLYIIFTVFVVIKLNKTKTNKPLYNL